MRNGGIAMSEVGDDKEQEISAFLARARPVSPSPEFVAAVCARLQDRIGAQSASGAGAPGKQTLWVPMALAATVALAIGIGLGVTAALGLHHERAPVATPPGTEPVRFTLALPSAQAVALTGDFTDWHGAIPLKRGKQGVWTVTVPLKPGQYEYVFVINGKAFVQDPHAVEYRPDGFGHRNAVLTVPSI